MFHSVESDCPCCGHMRAYHAWGRCTLTGYRTAEVSVDYPGGCGCTALTPNQTCQACGRLPLLLLLLPDCRNVAFGRMAAGELMNGDGLKGNVLF